MTQVSFRLLIETIDWLEKSSGISKNEQLLKEKEQFCISTAISGPSHVFISMEIDVVLTLRKQTENRKNGQVDWLKDNIVTFDSVYSL